MSTKADWGHREPMPSVFTLHCRYLVWVCNLVLWHWFFVIIVHCFQMAVLSLSFSLIAKKCHALVCPITRASVTAKCYCQDITKVISGGDVSSSRPMKGCYFSKKNHNNTEQINQQIFIMPSLILHEWNSNFKWFAQINKVWKKHLTSGQNAFNTRNITHNGCERPQSSEWLLG